MLTRIPKIKNPAPRGGVFREETVSHSRVAVSETSVSLARAMSAASGGECDPQGFRIGAAHQSLHHFVAKAAWDDAAVLTAVRGHVLPAIMAHGPIRAWIVDDTGLPKKGKLSVGVARQY